MCADQYDESSFERKIQEANEAFCDALDAYCRAVEEDGTDPETGIQARDALRAYYESLASIMRAYNDISNWSRDGVPRAHLPRHAADLAMGLIDDLVAGRLRPSVDDLFFAPGRPGISAAQRRAIEAAVRYVEYARAFPPIAPGAVKKCAQAFGVDAGTVRAWAREQPQDPHLRSNQPRDSQEFMDLLEHHMKESADLYRNLRHVKTRP
jgi:hypothetical protein